MSRRTKKPDPRSTKGDDPAADGEKQELGQSNGRSHSPRLAVALSGGGFRASLFGLGAMWALADLRANKLVASISSVSGGSITNAAIAQRTTYRLVTSEAFAVLATDLARRMTGSWSIWRHRGTRIYVAVALLVVTGSFVAAAWIASSSQHRWWIAVAASLPVLVLAWRTRGLAADSYFRALHGTSLLSEFGAKGRDMSRQVQEVTDHVICATDLGHGSHVYFAPRFIYSPGHG